MKLSYEAKTYVVIAPHYFGKGASFEEAMANCKKAGYRKPRGGGKRQIVRVVSDAAPDKVEVYGEIGVNIEVPDGAVLMRFDIQV